LGFIIDPEKAYVSLYRPASDKFIADDAGISPGIIRKEGRLRYLEAMEMLSWAVYKSFTKS